MRSISPRGEAGDPLAWVRVWTQGLALRDFGAGFGEHVLDSEIMVWHHVLVLSGLSGESSHIPQRTKVSKTKLYLLRVQGTFQNLQGRD